MGDIVHAYQRQRRDFGRQCKFGDRHAKLEIDLAPEPDLRIGYIKRAPCDAVTSNHKEFSVHEVQHLPSTWYRKVEEVNDASLGSSGLGRIGG